MTQQDVVDDIPIGPCLRELENKLQETSEAEEWTVETVHQTQQRLSSIVIRLNNIRNSRLAINKLGPDLLYIIFTFVACYPESLGSAARNLSCVCHYWRKLALKWASLWAVVDINNSPSITHLYMTRSQNAPLTLKWISSLGFKDAPSKSYFITHASSILPRVRYLTAVSTYFNFISLHQAIKSAKLPPLRLRYLSISLLADFISDPKEPPLTHLIDNSCLRYIALSGVNLPWLEPPHNELTHFTFRYPEKPPAVSQLLAFISHCASLKVLDLNIIYPPTTADLRKIHRLDFPNLTTLRLEASGLLCYNYIRQFASHIGNLGALSRFILVYALRRPIIGSSLTSQHEQPEAVQLFGAIPAGVFPHFTKYQYLVIEFQDEMESVKIRGNVDVGDEEEPFDHQFVVGCSGLEPSVDYSPVIDLINMMPQVRHLTMKYDAWKIFTSMTFDIRKVFPCLRTLALTNCKTNALVSLPEDFRVERLVLVYCTVSFGILSSLVESAGVEVLELTECRDPGGIKLVQELFYELNTKGVGVICHGSDESDGELPTADLDEWSEPDSSDW